MQDELAQGYQSWFTVKPVDVVKSFAAESTLLSLVPFHQYRSNEAVLRGGFDFLEAILAAVPRFRPAAAIAKAKMSCANWRNQCGISRINRDGGMLSCFGTGDEPM